MAKEEDDYAVKAAKEWVQTHHDDSITDCDAFMKHIEDSVTELAAVIRKYAEAEVPESEYLADED